MPQVIERADLATNFDTHFSEVKDFAVKEGISFAGAVQRKSPGPGDALVETLERRDIRIRSDDFGASTNMLRVFEGDSDGDFALTIAYLQQCFRAPLTGQSVSPAYNPGPDPTNIAGAKEFAINSASDLPRAWEPYGVGTVEIEKPITPRPSLSQIIAEREFVPSSNWTAPIFQEESEEEDYLRDIAPGTQLPIVTIDVEGTTVALDKKGYLLKLPYEFFLLNNVTIQSIATYQRWRAANMEDAMVTQALKDLEAVAPNPTALTGGLTNENVAKMHMIAEDDSLCNLNVVIGDTSSIAEYVGGSAATSSGRLTGNEPNMLIAPARRMWIDSVVGNVIVARKSGVVDSGTNTARFLLFDNEKCLKQLMLVGGNVSEVDRNELDQTQNIANTVLYKIRAMAAAKNCAYDVTINTT